jgi:hypothetical protein
LSAGKSFRAKKKDPARCPGLLSDSRNLVMVMVMMMVVMRLGVRGNNRPRKNDNRYGSKE